MQNFQSKRKQDKPEPREIRDYKLRVMLNSEELAFLDSVRGRHSRAEAIRFLLIEEPPKSVPELNQGAWVILATAVANLNQIAHKLNVDETVGIEEVREQLSQFRSALVGAQI